MAKVLVVEDEQHYRDQIQTILSWEGYDVQSAASGREAIDVGARFRPDVLVTDWMLRDQIHGLHVVAVLRTVRPDLRTILITGFASSDLKSEAAGQQVFAFIEKPFGLEDLQHAVRRATEAAKPDAPPPPFGVVELDSDGRILHANTAAEEMFARTRAGRRTTHFSRFFAAGSLPDLDSAIEQWLAICPEAKEPLVWHIRVQPPRRSQSRLLVVQTPDSVRNLHLVELLLELREVRHSRWPFDGRVLVVDDDPFQRQLAVSQIQGAGAGCYAAETHPEALRLFTEDEGIRFVVLDYDMPGSDTAGLIEALRGVRPEVEIAGNSGTDHREDFARIGVEAFLFKPWIVSHLIRTFETRRRP